MLLMMQANPALVKSTDRQSNGDLASRVDGLKLDEPGFSPFTYVPPDPRATYRGLVNRCLDWDLEILKTLPEDVDVSLGVLSPEHVALLGECAIRWRLPPSFRAWVFLDAIVDRCEKGDVPVACVHEASAMVGKVQIDMPMVSWAKSDREGLDAALLRRDICLLAAVDSALAYGANGYHSPDFLEAVSDWLALDYRDTSHSTLSQLNTSIVERIRIQAYKSYIEEAGERLEREGSKTRAFAMDMAVWVEKEVKKLNKRFGDPITDKVDVVSTVVQQMLSIWFRDVEDAMELPPKGEDQMEEAFVLYRKAQKLLDMGTAFSRCVEPMHISFAPAFSPVVHQWLDLTALKTRQWADQALAVDNFEPTSENGPSSSVTDLFDSFRSASTFIMELNWPDEGELAYFATRLAKTFSLSINDYCSKMEQLFAYDMSQGDAVQPAQTAAKQKAWIEKAKSTLASLQGERKIQAFFNFTPASCVKLNNIEAARQQLDKLYEVMRVDDLAAYDTSQPLPSPDQQHYLFTVKIVLAEGLALDSPNKLPDSFVILSDEHGNRYAKTRTIYDDADPRWDETFDIPVKGNAWFMATIRHRQMTGKHDLLGRAYLRLDPNQFADLISKDVLLPLDTRGHLLLRISMEGERDDIQFHFGRAFRWLKRTESDMVRTFVDKMTPVLRDTLSRAAIKSVLKPSGTALPNLPIDYNEALGKISAAYRSVDYNEALGKLTSAYRSAMGESSPSVPRKRPPTDAEIESAIHPLFDYLDANNHTLASTLSRDAMQSVMAKLWKQILMTIEALIVPPLSDKPSHMRALSDGELDIALKWLKFLRDFFYVGGDESGVPLATLQNAKFNEILSVRIYYDWKTDDLMEECIRGFQSTLKYRATKPSKSLLSQRNLGTIRARKSAKKAMPANAGGNTEMIMRILRMRSGTQEFLAQQLQTISVVKLENPKKGKSLTRR
ncbi:hypothetical protein BCR39DRAFT_473965 [Naematelia encephala]|uniref:Uncharacterized protein n=1 Tax=Naematelia encephala TaxID=71784 RepID=A0A1Y2AIU1_9TREE|nr:hypothetical protein BCR39DRAFT_473965 [Naematelia encephala]